ncbi:hypothetical protein Nepgr_010565 [Nepenthes gracilis]|uniref:Uncharacterized protein n=1 Tax=Nepenthes gracilis TaxID=150966 RepID=A0AAD3SDH9_NEPGR|nr:hypothetical protein Nepgr_010565 [Nepenthes gracilis]
MKGKADVHSSNTLSPPKENRSRKGRRRTQGQQWSAVITEEAIDDEWRLLDGSCECGGCGWRCLSFFRRAAGGFDWEVVCGLSKFSGTTFGSNRNSLAISTETAATATALVLTGKMSTNMVSINAQENAKI